MPLSQFWRESSLYLEGLADAHRESCVAFARKYHPLVFERTRPIIESCDDTARLEQWLLAAPDLSDSEFLKLLGA